MEHRLPLITRLTLSAIGQSQGGRVRAPIDPVAAWILQQQPDLHPITAAQAAFTTIRARTLLVDRMLTDIGHLAIQDGQRLVLWHLGPGFDARWYRLLPRLSNVYTGVREVEDPGLLTVKHSFLEASPYADHWKRVVRRAMAMSKWSIENRPGITPVVLMEGLAGRMEQDELEGTLARIHEATTECSVIFGLPGVGADDASRWSVTRMRRRGWSVIEDARMGPRGRLLLAAGGDECPGTYPLRVVRMERRA